MMSRTDRVAPSFGRYVLGRSLEDEADASTATPEELAAAAAANPISLENSPLLRRLAEEKARG